MPVAGAPFKLYLNANASNALRGRGEFVLVMGFNKWSIKKRYKKLLMRKADLPSQGGADWCDHSPPLHLTLVPSVPPLPPSAFLPWLTKLYRFLLLPACSLPSLPDELWLSSSRQDSCPLLVDHLHLGAPGGLPR